MIEFPDSPTTGDLHAAGGASWRWDGTKWTANTSGAVSGGDVSGGSTSIDGELSAYNGPDGKTLKQSFAKLGGPATTVKTYTLPNADATILTGNAAVTVGQGGTNATSASGATLDNISGFASTGTIARTGSGTYAFRTITGTSNRLSVSNGDGVGGNPTIDIHASYVGQNTITTLGTIGTGTWAGTTIAVDHGGTGLTSFTAGTDYATVAQAKAEFFTVAVSDESTAITTGAAKITFRMPFAMSLTQVRASLSTVSSSGNPAIDVNEGGVSIFSTTLTIDSGEKTSTTAAIAAVISDASIADDAEMTIDIDTAGTGAKGLKVTFIGTRA